MPRPIPLILASILACGTALAANVPVLDKQQALDRFTWWDNRDWDWYKANIPFFESPDAEIDATYYYRWELVTKHLVYASPRTGYTFTEFIDRPGWSGAYGSISCPLGHHFYELRWLKDPRIVDDYARYWFTTPGAQPRSYTNWYGDAMWATYLVRQDRDFIGAVLPFMEQQVAGWSTREFWDQDQRMYKWNGMNDGMETNINSRQTPDWFRGAEGYRPTINSYLYGDLTAIANAAGLLGDTAKAAAYQTRARELRMRVQQELWDPARQFFYHQFAKDEPGKEWDVEVEENGVKVRKKVKHPIKAKSLTHQSGRYAGDPHGRELIGYVPWQFNLPEPGKGFEVAWKKVVDPTAFLAPFGLTCTERQDPLFFISPGCCVWSGNSWPFATAQTLTAMANVLNNYQQDVITAQDWFTVMHSYTLGQRMDGRPFIAEAQHPDTGSWSGHNTYGHSEHYFHSSYCDLVISGLAGLRPRADDVVEVHPLVPAHWAYFCLDDVAYHGHRVSVVWDRDGTRYGRGKGLMIFADGALVAQAERIGRLQGKLPVPAAAPPVAPRRHNFAVNNEGEFFPQVQASHTGLNTLRSCVNDGNYWYLEAPPNRWTSAGSTTPSDWITIDFGVARPVDTVELYLLDDGAGKPVRTPTRYDLEWWNGTSWAAVPGQQRRPEQPTGHQANTIRFPVLQASRLRAVLTHQPGAASGLSEFTAWGEAALPLPPPDAPVGNLAFNRTGKGFPQATASFTSPFDRINEINDGRTFLTIASRNRWTAYQSPNPSDWVQFDFGKPVTVGRLELCLWGDKGGVRAPRSYTVQIWDGAAWKDAQVLKCDPQKPTIMTVNEVVINPVVAERLRVVLVHDPPGFSGVSELMIWEK